MAVIRALEVGFGTTSLTTGYADGEPVIKTFSSFVAQTDPNKSGLNAGLNKRDTVSITINGQNYEIGPDAQLASDKSSSRVLNSSYITSDQYQALLFGSMLYMNADTIDLLVLALPVEHWSRREQLKSLVVGKHTIKDRTIEVKNAWVIVQPLGGLLDYADSIGQSGFDELREQTVLSVDPGFGTFDYVTSAGLKLNDTRSGGADLGMSSVLSACAKTLRTAFPNLHDFPIEKIDEAFYKNDGYIRVSGKKYPFPVCKGETVDNKPVNIEFDLRPAIESVTQNAVTKLKNVVGNGGDIDLIILMGGACNIYKAALQSAYPDHDIVVVKNPITSICRGMHLGGMQYYEALKKMNAA